MQVSSFYLIFLYSSAAIPNPPSNVQVEALEDKTTSTIRVKWGIPDEWSRVYDPSGGLLRYKIRYAAVHLTADLGQSTHWQEVNMKEHSPLKTCGATQNPEFPQTRPKPGSGKCF